MDIIPPASPAGGIPREPLRPARVARSTVDRGLDKCVGMG